MRNKEAMGVSVDKQTVKFLKKYCEVKKLNFSNYVNEILYNEVDKINTEIDEANQLAKII